MFLSFKHKWGFPKVTDVQKRGKIVCKFLKILKFHLKLHTTNTNYTVLMVGDSQANNWSGGTRHPFTAYTGTNWQLFPDELS